jgi:hypothetical protein
LHVDRSDLHLSLRLRGEPQSQNQEADNR